MQVGRLMVVGAQPVSFVRMAEPLRSIARDLGLPIGTDFIASPLHGVVRIALLSCKHSRRIST
jgi:hypothetical protein